jgi:2-dehydropantoate 2-reductase
LHTGVVVLSPEQEIPLWRKKVTVGAPLDDVGRAMATDVTNELVVPVSMADTVDLYARVGTRVAGRGVADTETGPWTAASAAAPPATRVAVFDVDWERRGGAVARRRGRSFQLCKGVAVRLIVYGAGAIGGLIGALLSEHGQEVVLIARGRHAEVIRASGLVVASPSGSRVVEMAVVAEPAAARIGPGDVILMAMKSQDTLSALVELTRVAPAATPVVCLQNGVENERAALRRFEFVYGVCVICPATHLEPGVVESESAPIPGLLDIGRYPAGVDEGSAVLAEVFRQATFESIERPDIMRWKYRKLLTNLGNAVQVVCHPPGHSEIRRMVLAEGEACLAAAGIDVVSAEEDDARRAGKLVLRPVAGRSRGGGSSWQSLQRGTGSVESDYLNGEITLLGRLYGVPTPVNALLQELAGELARRGLPPGALSAQEFLDRLSRRTSPALPASAHPL